MAETVPLTIGKYRVEDVLGRGAMGVVYRAYDEGIDRHVALKTVRTDLLSGAEAEQWLERFQREARAAARCLHPNIVTVFDFGEADGVTYISMEYVKGRQLQAYLGQRQPFATEFALSIVIQVLRALSFAHDNGIVHRDIKPSNIMMLDNGVAKVTDFGIARLDSLSLSQVGMMVGTPSYMSPEQFKGGVIDHRTDLFATGIILYELLTGQKPFPGNTVTEVMYKVMNHPPRDPADFDISVHPALKTALMKALAREPDDRFQTAQSFRAALENVLTARHPSSEADRVVDDMATVFGTPLPQPEIAPVPPPAVPGDVGGELEEAVLRKATEDLASHIGPVAKVLVRSVASKVTTVPELYQSLAENIGDDKERTTFLRRATRAAMGLSASRGTLSGSAGSIGASRPVQQTGDGVVGVPSFTEAELSRACHELTVVLGPIAGVIVKKMAGKASTVSDLHRLLADQIPDFDEREAFLQRVTAP